MGTRGVRALESDEGLKCRHAFEAYALSNPSAQLSKIMDLYQKQALLPKNEEETGLLYDYAVLVLAELLLEFCKNKKLNILFYDKELKRERQLVLRIFNYTEKELSYLLRRIEDIVMPAGEEHELYEIWERDSRFMEWKAYVNSLLDGLEELPLFYN